MCHDMTGLAIMPGRLGAGTFACPLRGLIAWTDRLGTRVLARCSGSSQVRSVPSSFDGGWTLSLQPK